MGLVLTVSVGSRRNEDGHNAQADKGGQRAQPEGYHERYGELSVVRSAARRSLRRCASARELRSAVLGAPTV